MSGYVKVSGYTRRLPTTAKKEAADNRRMDKKIRKQGRAEKRDNREQADNIRVANQLRKRGQL